MGVAVAVVRRVAVAVVRTAGAAHKAAAAVVHKVAVVVRRVAAAAVAHRVAAAVHIGAGRREVAVDRKVVDLAEAVAVDWAAIPVAAD